MKLDKKNWHPQSYILYTSIKTNDFICAASRREEEGEGKSLVIVDHWTLRANIQKTHCALRIKCNIMPYCMHKEMELSPEAW